MVLAIGAVLFMSIAAGVGWYIVGKSTREFPTINIPSFSTVPVPVPTIQVPSVGPVQPEMPVSPSETNAPPGGQLSVAGVGENKTIACNDSDVSVSGVSNTVTITGHCTAVTVSGIQNKVTLDSPTRSTRRVRQRGDVPLRLTGHQLQRIQRGPAGLSQ